VAPFMGTMDHIIPKLGTRHMEARK
jgi:hypothetical protein